MLLVLGRSLYPTNGHGLRSLSISCSWETAAKEGSTVLDYYHCVMFLSYRVLLRRFYIACENFASWLRLCSSDQWSRPLLHCTCRGSGAQIVRFRLRSSPNLINLNADIACLSVHRRFCLFSVFAMNHRCTGTITYHEMLGDGLLELSPPGHIVVSRHLLCEADAWLRDDNDYICASLRLSVNVPEAFFSLIMIMIVIVCYVCTNQSAKKQLSVCNARFICKFKCIS